MPEGPEVQVVVDGLQHYVGRTIIGVATTPDRPWVLDKTFPSRIDDRIEAIRRVGKFIIFDHVSKNKTVIHLSFTGMFLDHQVDYLALKLFLDNGETLFYHDKRGLSRWRCMTASELLSDKTISAHKVDALSSSKSTILERLQILHKGKSKKELKPFLLDFHNLCGIGNIYASEICFEAKLSPRKIFIDCTEDDLIRLSVAIPLVLRRAYEAGGSSIESFNNIKGINGKAQRYHKVYAKEICPECGSPIKSFRQAGRSTYFCPICQKEV